MNRQFLAESARCRAAQQAWAARPLRERLAPIREIRYLLVEQADALTAAVDRDIGRDPAELVATDLLPTAAACKFLLNEGERILRPRRVRSRPLWLLGCRDTVHRRPHGLVGLIGTWNYPVFLNAVPIAQALTAGNGVLWKPSELAPRTAELLHELFLRASVPADLFVRLPSTREAGPQLADADVDFVHFTGSDAVGRKLAAKLGERLIPSVMELSGVDAMFVLPDANVSMAAKAAWYGATLNGGQTCMATRRAFVHRDVYEKFVNELRPLVDVSAAVKLVVPEQAERVRRLIAEAVARGAQALSDGRASDGVPTAILNASPELAVCREPCFAPLIAVIPFDTIERAIAMHDTCPFGLTAAVFTSNRRAADELASRLRVGSVVVNDVIVTTAHPATPFGGRGASGWGVTQGEEGLQAMTVPQVVTHRGGWFRPHLERDPASADVVRGLLRLTHGRGWRERWSGLRQMVAGMKRTRG